MGYWRKPPYYFGFGPASNKDIEVVSFDGLGAGDFPVPFPKMKREIRNMVFSLVLAAVWLGQVSLQVYHVLSEHTDSTVSSSETDSIIKNLDDGSLSCHLCVLLNNPIPLYTQEITALAIASLMIYLPIHHLKRDFFLLLPDKVWLRGPHLSSNLMLLVISMAMIGLGFVMSSSTREKGILAN